MSTEIEIYEYFDLDDDLFLAIHVLNNKDMNSFAFLGNSGPILRLGLKILVL